MCKSVRPAKVILLLLVTVAFILVLLMNLITIATPQVGRSIGIFPDYNASEIWFDRDREFNITFTPAPWTFGIWAPIFTFQALLIAYCWTTICRRACPDGPFLCEDPDLAPFGVLVWHFMSSLCGTAWGYLAERVSFENSLYIPQSAVLFAFTICLYLCLVSSYWNLHQVKGKLVNCYKRVDYGLVVGFVQNGVSMYATWCTIASFLNLNTALIVVAKVDTFVSAVCCLGAVILIVVVYAIADLTVLDIVTRYVFTPHIVVIWACAGSIARNFVAWSVLTIMTIALLGAVVLALIVKIIGVCIRSRRRPMLDTDIYQLNKNQEL